MGGDENFSFQADLKEIIRLPSENLYSGADVKQRYEAYFLTP